MSEHKYSDQCICVECTAAWDKALLAALDRGDKKKQQDEHAKWSNQKTADRAQQRGK